MSYTTGQQNIFGVSSTINTNAVTSAVDGFITYGNPNIYLDHAYNAHIINPLKNLTYFIEFDFDKDDILKNNISGIKNKKMLFNGNYDGNRLQPYEYIMNLIEDNKKMTVKVDVSDILTITYTNLQFLEIKNNMNFNFNSDCDFSTIKVKFKYDKILYKNHKLTQKEIRTDKLKKLSKK